MQGDETTFINGYYENKDVEPHVPVKYKNHFRFNRPLGTLEILHLSLKDRGIYTCVTANQKSFSFNLILPDSVNYSRPEILLGRRNGEVVVNCSSSAGHPFRVPEWRLLPENSHTQWDVVDNGGWLDNVTDLWSVFSTVTLNCSRPLNISCSVGGAISKELSICHEHQDIMLIVAGTVMASMIFVALVVAVVKMRRVSYNRASNGPAAFPLRSTSPPLSGHGTGEEENSKLTQSC
ncbi:uncharacterized protein LOC114773093 [Denticeps clupeoides]|nr:uncharacterized protein LOC114773093 [Denticeps clupeoides]